MDKLLLTVPETSRATGIGLTRVYELVKRGEIPSVRVGRLVRIPANGLRSWIAEAVEKQTLANDRHEPTSNAV